MLSKSKVKKVKTKKAVIKKSKATSEENEEKENSSIGIPDSDVKMEDIKKATRKRPLEDIDVEGQLSFFNKYLPGCFTCLAIFCLLVSVTAIFVLCV